MAADRCVADSSAGGNGNALAALLSGSTWRSIAAANVDRAFPFNDEECDTLEPIQVISYYTEIVTDTLERSVEDAVLIAPDIAVTADRSTLYFIRVKPSEGEHGLYDDDGLIVDVVVSSMDEVDIATIPPEALTFALWAAGVSSVPLATAV
jgi:hypothetical protein